jgi:hypothetical protein
MTGVHQPFETIWPSVGILHGEGINPVIAPVSIAGELSHRHELYGGDAQFLQFIQMRSDGVKGSLTRESTHVEFIDDIVFQRETGPVLVFPGESGVHHLRWAEDTLRLESRNGVGAVFLAIKSVQVEAIWRYVLYHGAMIAMLGFLQRQDSLLRCHDMYLYCLGQRRPHQKLAAAISHKHGTQTDF